VSGADGYKWSKHSKDEIEKGWVLKAESAAELAKKLELDVVALTRRLEDYNAQTGAEKNTFGRDHDSMQPIKPPFYAMQMTPLLYNTQGGPQRNENAEILDPDGRVIEASYGAGEYGSIWGHAYQSSTNFAETIVFGGIAGKEAAKYCGLKGQGQEVPVALRNKEVENA
jgi:succinate dehydrogenase/fumarate reductase flavoprotein subunit